MACFFLFSCTNTKTPQKKKTKSDLETLHYKGMVKMVTYKIYKASDDSGKVKKENLISKVVTKCDSAGYFMEQSNYKGGDKLVYQVFRKYDSRHNVLKEERVQDVMQYMSPGDTKPDSLSITVDTFMYKFDAQGNKLEVNAKENGKPWYKDVNRFDSSGNMLKQKEYHSDTLNKIATYKYDNLGRDTEMEWFHPDSTLIYKYIYKYDANGNILELKTMKKGDTLQWKYVMTYDSAGNKTSDINYNRDNSVNWDWRYKFTKLDAKGNWIEQVFYDSGKPSTITERTIEYYK
jgi:hypothetical protein